MIPTGAGASLITERARPKINLTLSVAGRRADGYHELTSLVVFADPPEDLVTLDPATNAFRAARAHAAEGGARGKAVETLGPFAQSIVGENLLGKTLRLARARIPRLIGGRVTLLKMLPVASGIGGGSADAAALIRALRRVNPSVDARAWEDLAVAIGADVSVCLHSRPAWITGTGAIVHHVEQFPSLDAVLVNPCAPVPADKTARVFAALAAPLLRASYRAPTAPVVNTHERLIEFIIATGNALERPARAVLPSVAAVLDALRATAGCRVAAMSGAGPTCFAVYDDAQTAQMAAAALEAVQPEWWVEPTTMS